MKTKTKRVVGQTVATGAILAVVAGGLWFSTTLSSQTPEPAPTPTKSHQVVNPVPQPAPTSADRFVDDLTEPVVVEAPEPAPEAPQEPSAPVEQAPEPQQEPQPAPEPEPQPQPEPEPPPPPAPVKCPSGSTAVESDGTNDTACLPNVCFTLTLPDPNHPECDAPFRP